MGELLVIVGLVVAVIAIIGIIAKARGGKRPATAAPRRDPLAADQPAHGFGPRELGPGAIVAYGGIDYVVRGSITLRVSPGAEVIVDDRVHRLEESVEAVYSCEWTTGLPERGRMRYQDMRTGDGSSLLSFENWDGAGWEVSSGRPMSRGELTVYPAPPAAGDPDYRR